MSHGLRLCLEARQARTWSVAALQLCEPEVVAATTPALRRCLVSLPVQEEACALARRRVWRTPVAASARCRTIWLPAREEGHKGRWDARMSKGHAKGALHLAEPGTNPFPSQERPPWSASHCGCILSWSLVGACGHTRRCWPSNLSDLSPPQIMQCSSRAAQS